MLKGQVFEDVFEESFTGYSFVMKEVYTKKSIVRNILTRAKKVTLKEFSANLKKTSKNCDRNQVSVKQSITPCEKAVDFKLSKTLTDEEANGHFEKDVCSSQDVVMFLIPFKKSSRSTINRDTTIEYTFWNVTDLQQNFGVLVTTDKNNTESCFGELWAILNPTTFPPEQDTLGFWKTRIVTTPRLVLFTNRILRIGLLSGFQLCLHICENGSVCGTPFYNRQSKKDGHLPAILNECPRHRKAKKIALMSVKSSLCKKRSFYTNDDLLKQPATKKQCDEQRNHVTDQYALQKGKQLRFTPDENQETNIEKHSISEITLVSLTSFLQDFLHSVTLSKNDETNTETEEKKEYVKPPKNLDLRVQHVIKRLNEFISLEKQYSSASCHNMLSLLLKLVKQLVLQIEQYQISKKVKTKLDSVIFFTKRYITSHFQPSQTLPLVKEML